MYDVKTRERVLALVAQGRSLNSVSKQTGMSRAAIRSWQTRLEPVDKHRGRSCPRCAEEPTAIEHSSSYAYLLGLYLGDGCISAAKRGVYSLRIACADAWPGLIDACAEAIRISRPHNKDAHPWEFIRGLIHSDGCRITNWATRMVRGERKRYEYPRYFFTNKSDDIRKLFSDTLTAVGVEWTTLARGSKPLNISVARRASVALMDAHVGPKY
ncbi:MULTISPECIES: transcriptional regulator [unclassified Streptomyces]|uniref:transcriptional regulator n=1 Tax=unclassified Streptomyces TaxID=2593676 RepID=UPI00081E4447|nr:MULTISPECIES: transcriptional regulator [unclassified Streptomyces]SCD38583.1 hypothetical protein GA0115243_101328 [Streptomyces sp. ScaeMP-e83]